MTNTLLLIDAQNDFHPGGSLAIPTANDDAGRIADLITKHSSKIDRIVATMDSHQKLHIANPYFWTNDKGERPNPFTIISAKDIQDGVWKPRNTLKVNLDETLDATVFEGKSDVLHDDGTLDLPKYCLEYAKRLESNGRFQICVWPEHCLIGSKGHAIVDPIQNALHEWSANTGGSVEWLLKGQNLLTEMYSALQADVPVNHATQFNQPLFDSLMQSSKLLVAGQAMSHCVNYTLRDMVQHATPEQCQKMYLLTDCASPVPGFDGAAETFQTDMKVKGVHLIESSGVDGIL